MEETRMEEGKDEGKVKLSLCLTKYHAMKTYWGVEVQLHAFLISALDGGEWSASRTGRFDPWERAERQINKDVRQERERERRKIG
jgi:hypothetical protein